MGVELQPIGYTWTECKACRKKLLQGPLRMGAALTTLATPTHLAGAYRPYGRISS
jgi:hypothetical protein